MVDWTDPTGKRYGAQVLITERQAISALSTLSGPARDTPVTLDLRIESGGSVLRATFKNVRAAVRLRNATIKVFKRKG